MAETPPTLTVPPNSGLVVAQSPSSDASRVVTFSGGVEASAQPASSAPPPQPAAEPPARSEKAEGPTPAAAPPSTNAPSKTVVVNFSQYAKIEALGDGEAKQKLRKFEDDLQVAQKELGQA